MAGADTEKAMSFARDDDVAKAFVQVFEQPLSGTVRKHLFESSLTFPFAYSLLLFRIYFIASLIFADAGSLLAPLHGVKVAVKDVIDIRGMGLSSIRNLPRSHCVSLIDLL